MLSLLPLSLLPVALAAPGLAPDAGTIHIPIVRRSVPQQSRIANLPQIMDSIRTKYGFKSANQKRSTTTTTAITDEQNDSSYSAVVSIGSPAQEFNLILDTGSSDLWVATNTCSDCPSGITYFDPSSSSSFKNESSSLQITYGSGSVEGYVAEDTVNFAGFSISPQKLLAVTETSQDLLSDGLSGIMGLGWESISALETSPFWATIYNESQLSSPVFSFYLERWITDPTTLNTAPGGTFTLGGTNTSLYQGQVEFINMPSGTTPSYWLQQVQSVTVQGNTVSISSSDGIAAIDTGTTLIGAPSSVTQEIWSNVVDATALSGEYAGMYAFPCGTSVDISLNFGGNDWSISTDDMNLGTIGQSGSTQYCAGAIFDIGDTGNGAEGVPSWIVGDTFLKNVYSVFQANPPAVGFAQLANGLNNATGSSGSATYTGSAGVPIPTGTGSGGITNAASSTTSSMLFCLVFTLVGGFLVGF